MYVFFINTFYTYFLRSNYAELVMWVPLLIFSLEFNRNWYHDKVEAAGNGIHSLGFQTRKDFMYSNQMKWAACVFGTYIQW